MPVQEARVELLPKPGFLIGDDFVDDGSGGELEHVYAATGRPTTRIPLAGAEEMARAVQAARAALPTWRAMPRNERRNLMLRFADLLVDEAPRIEPVAVIESAIPASGANRTLTNAVDAFRYFAGWTDKVGGQVIPTWPVQTLNYTVDEPYGVLALFLPFNAPMYSAGMTVAPALAAGNTVVVKPSSLAPFSLLLFGQLALEAGVPPGVLNVVPTDAKGGETLTRTPGVDKVFFMGSGKSAKYLLRAAADRLIPVTAELGGKSANLIFDDVDPGEAATLAIGSGLGGLGGQGCALGSRILVQSSMYDEFVEHAKQVAASMVVGDPVVPDTQVGPVVNEAACVRILDVVARAEKESEGRLVIGGERVGGDYADGYFIEPTLFADVDNSSRLAAEEIFGPVLSIIPFDMENDAVRIANDSPYGLAAFIQTSDASRLHRLAYRLDVGNVFANGFVGVPISIPFGGVKESGFGRLGGEYAIREFTRPKNVSVGVR